MADTDTRIGLIRHIIKEAGGNPPMKCGSDYYADGPRNGSAWHGSKMIRERDETCYKVDKNRDGLTYEQRVNALKAFRAHPRVKDAYFSRPYTRNCGPAKGIVSKGHLKIVFQGTIN